MPGTRHAEIVGWVERSETHRLQFAKVIGFAEFIIGPAEGRTRWLYPF
jgi:hypothetical protein